MDDLISRQAAINALNKLDVSDGVGISSVACDLQEEAIRSIENLPFAQPEIIRCKDCKHSRSYKHTKEYVACEVDCEPIDRDSDFFCKYGEWRGEEE